MPEQTGWKVEPSFDLPEGFELRADCDHFLYLYYKRAESFGTVTEAVAVFNAQASPAAIVSECENYLGRMNDAKMTASELKESLPTMIVWMAETATREGVKRSRRYYELREIEREKESAGKPYNYSMAHECYEGVRVAAEVLWKLFYSISADCQKAIEEVAKTMDGYLTYLRKSYFDEFVEALEKVSGEPVRIRDEE